MVAPKPIRAHFQKCLEEDFSLGSPGNSSWLSVSVLADNLFRCVILIGGLCLPITRFSNLLLSNFLPAQWISCLMG